MVKKSQGGNKSDSSANIGFEAKLWLTADKLRNNMDAALTGQFAESAKFEQTIQANLRELGNSLGEKHDNH